MGSTPYKELPHESYTESTGAAVGVSNQNATLPIYVDTDEVQQVAMWW